MGLVSQQGLTATQLAACATAPVRPYTFLELTRALCDTCLRIVDAKLVLQDGCVYMRKQCPTHGPHRVLVSTDPAYWRQTRQALKPGQMPLVWNTSTENGCPYDCGLCPDHEQHSCVTLIEITDRCNLTCPTCFADSSPTAGHHRSLSQVTAMLDAVVRNEGKPDVVQISGGEPTLHPQFFDIMDAARARPIQHLMINTNGIRIAQDAAFAQRLASYGPGLEVYLQFDSLRPQAHEVLRGENLTEIRAKALARLNALNLSTTLVCVVRRDLNLDELGDLLRYAQAQPCVRGVTFQPVQTAGRLQHYDARQHRLLLSEIRTAILDQYPVFTPADVLPVPCHPDCLAMAYGLKVDGQVLPLSSFVDPAQLLLSSPEDGNTVVLKESLQRRLFELFSLNHSPQSARLGLGNLLCCLPTLTALPAELSYQNVFRVLIVEFMDVETMDIRSVKRSCIHIVHPETLHIIPFDTYNLFYRSGQSLPPFLGGSLTASHPATSEPAPG